MTLFERKLMLGCIGGAVAAYILAMAIVMIVRGTKRLKSIRTETEYGTKA